MIEYSAGIVTAYGSAVRAGYTGSYEDFCRQQAQYAENALAVEQAKQDAQTAKDQAQTAKDDAVSAKNTAVTAKDDAVSAKNTAVSAKDDAVSAKDTAVTKAQEADASATSAGQSATSADQSARSAEQSAQDISENLEQIQTNKEDIGKLKADFNELDDTVNGSTVDIEYVKNQYVATGGAFTPYNNWSRTKFIPVPTDGNGVRYTLTGRASSYCAFYSDASESSYLRMFSINKTDGIPYREQTVPDNARYFVISNYTADIATFTYLNPPQLEVGLVGKVAELDERVTVLEESPSGDTVPEIILPPYAVAVVGHEFNMYTENVVICKNLNDYIWAWKMLPYATQYNQYDDRFSVIPTTGSERTYTLSLTCVDKITGATLTSASMSLIIVSDSAITGKKMLMIGDSLTATGYSAYEIQSVLSENGVESLGTLTATPWIGNVQKSVNIEGRGGWGAYDYMHTASKNGNTNAFLNPSTNLFDFSYYMTQQGYSDVDIVMLNLGTNGTEDIQRDVEAMGQIISSIHSYNANIPVVVHLTPPPATQNGWTYINHGAGAEEFRLKTLAMVKAQIEAFGNKQSEKTYISCVYGCLDRYHDFAYKEVAISQRNPFTVTRQIQNVHPASYGYYKFADVYWGMIEHLLS